MLVEAAGYATRIAPHFNKESWAPFIVQGVFILILPLFFAATIYMMLGRAIRLAGGEGQSTVPVKWLTRVFVGADVLTLHVQGAGQ